MARAVCSRPVDHRRRKRLRQEAENGVRGRRRRAAAASVIVVGLTVAVGAAWAATQTGQATPLRVAASAPMSGNGVAGPPQLAPTSASGASTATSAQGVSALPAANMCEGRLAQLAGPVNPTHVSLVAVYDTTAAAVTSDDGRRHGPGFRSPFAQRPPAEHEGVCWFDADSFLATPAAMLDPAKRAAVIDRIQEIVRPDGVPILYTAGHKASLELTPIATSATGTNATGAVRSGSGQ